MTEQPNKHEDQFRKTDKLWEEYRKQELERRMRDLKKKKLPNFDPEGHPIWNYNRVDFSHTAGQADTFDQLVRKTALEAAEILIKKHHDYGPDNINNAPGGAMNGLLVRIHDKMERLKTLTLRRKQPKFESIEDTLLDMVNYSIIGLLVQRGKWPKS